MKKDFYASFSAVSAVAAAVAGFLYAISFIILKSPEGSACFLMLSGLFALPVMIALFGRLRSVEANYALLALILGVVGAFGYLVHGGYDLANVLNPPASPNLDLPSQIDPRGLLVFGVTGLAILKFSWLASKSKEFGQGFSLLGVVSGLLLLVIYLARLTVLSPASPILLYPVLAEGFVVNPLWYLWLALILSAKNR